jgi:hypothetical protein
MVACAAESVARHAGGWRGRVHTLASVRPSGALPSSRTASDARERPPRRPRGRAQLAAPSRRLRGRFPACR